MYSRTKQCICLILLVILCATVICGSTATAREPVDSTPPLETVMSIKSKTTNSLSERTTTDNQNKETSSITYSYDEYGNGCILGPTDYKFIDSDRFYVLDTQGKYIRTYSIEKSALINSIDISYCEYPERAAYRDGIYYVYDIDRREIVSFAETGTMLGVIPLPDIGDESDFASIEEYNDKDIALSCADLVNHDGEIMLLLETDGAYDYCDYRLVGNEFVECEPLYSRVTDMSQYEAIYWSPVKEEYTMMTTITYGGHSWTFDAFGIGMDILGVDEDNNLYLYCVVHLCHPDGTFIEGECVRVYDADSNLVRGVELDLDEFSMVPIVPARMGKDNNLYFFAGVENEMRLMKLNTHEGFEINNEELYQAVNDEKSACCETTP